MPSIFARSRKSPDPLPVEGSSPHARSSRLMLQRFAKGQSKLDIDELTQRIILPSLPVADEDVTRLGLWESGRSMARQDRWDMLSAMITTADDARLLTAGGRDEAGLLALGAQSDVTAAAREALDDGQVPDMDGIASLEENAAEMPDDHAIALVVGLAHLNIARAWLGAPTGQHKTTSRHPEHLAAAEKLLTRFDAEEHDAPSLAAAQAALAEHTAPHQAVLVASYARAILLDPHNPTHMRAFGRALRDRLSDTPSVLDQEARRMIKLTTDIWGKGAYVWIHIDVLGDSETALQQLDLTLFSEGLQDILATSPDQHIINELAAFCAKAMQAMPDAATPDGDARQMAFLENLDRILSQHLQELHPLIWSEAATPQACAPRASAPRALIAQGRKAALQIIAGRFADQLADGSTIAFSPAGMYRLPAI